MKKFLMIITLLLITVTYATSGSFEKKMNILVYPFKFEGNKQYSWVASGLTDTVISDLNRIKDVSVFSDEDRKKAVKEMELGMTGIFDEKTVMQVGRVIGANVIFTGNIQIMENKIRVNAKLINVETTKIENTVKLDGTVEDIFNLEDEIVFGLMAETEKINIPDIKTVIFDKDDKKKIEEKFKPKKEAYEWYAKGLEILDINPQTALNYFKKAIEIDGNYIDALTNAGITAGNTLNLFNEGLNYLNNADIIFQKHNNMNSLQYAGLVMSIGNVYNGKGQLDFALKYYMKCKIIKEKLGLQNTASYASILSNIGVVYRDKGQLDLAIEYHMKSKAIRDKLGLQNIADYAGLMMNIGNVYYNKGQHNLAKEYYIKGKEIEDKLGLQNTADYAELMTNIGVYYSDEGQLDLAMEYHMKAKIIKDKRGLQNTADYAGLMNNIGMVYFNKGQQDLALEYFFKDKAIEDKLGLQNTSGYADLMINIGHVYNSKGQLDLAMEYYMKDKVIEDKLGLQNTSGYGMLMYAIAIVYGKENKDKLAGEHYRKAYNIFEKAGYSGSWKDEAKINAERLGY